MALGDIGSFRTEKQQSSALEGTKHDVQKITQEISVRTSILLKKSELSL
jgi:hypothetical protein